MARSIVRPSFRESRVDASLRAGPATAQVQQSNSANHRRLERRCEAPELDLPRLVGMQLEAELAESLTTNFDNRSFGLNDRVNPPNLRVKKVVN